MDAAEFNIQRHLEAMESRIREDVKGIRDSMRATDERAREAAVTVEEHAGRLKALEEKAAWIGAGFGAGLFAIVGFVWHVLTNSK